MSNSLKTVNYRNPSTPQTKKAAPGQKRNNAGGFSFVIDDFERAKRFVILGADDGFYVAGAKLAEQNAKAVKRVIEAGRSQELVDFIVDVSLAGRAAKQQPGLFALAMASSFGSTEDKQYALSKLSAVARTGTTLFEFVGFALQFRSWGRALKNAVASWYITKPIDKLAYQMVKYQQRDGWSHGDLLRLTHAKAEDNAAFNALAQWALGRNEELSTLPAVVEGFIRAKSPNTSEANLIKYIGEYDLTWEMVPNDKRSTAVWKNLVTDMPLGALLRQLPTLTRKEVFKPLTKELVSTVGRLTNAEEIERARLHPINILLAMKVYASGGRYSRGSNTWTPIREIIDALNTAFYLAFKNVEPTGQRFLLGLDVSGSMHGAGVSDSVLTAAEAVGALSLVIQKTEPMTHTVAFAAGGYETSNSRGSGGMWGRRSGIVPMDISHSQRLDDVLRKMHTFDQTWGGTDCALPMLYAKDNNLEVDVFTIMTDNDTWAGSVHPHEALQQYRKASGIDAKMVVLATTASRFSIADSSDAGMLDIAGFDSSVPTVLAEFSRS